MSALKRARAERRASLERLHHHRDCARASCARLTRAYQRHWLASLGLAAGAGFALSAQQRWRPPSHMLRNAFNWSMILVRALL